MRIHAVQGHVEMPLKYQKLMWTPLIEALPGRLDFNGHAKVML